MTLAAVLNAAKRKYGFLTDRDVAVIAKEDRTRLILVRFNGCRALVPAQSVQHLIEAVEAGGKDYVRDVSLPASDPAMRR